MMFTAGFLFGMGAAWLALGVLVAVWPRATPEGRHFADRNPVRDEITRVLNDSRRNLRRSPAPWAHRPKRHSDKTPMEGS